MKKYMLVYVIRDEDFLLPDENGKRTPQQEAVFYDDYDSARNAYMDLECGIGAFVQMYEWMKDDEEMDDKFASYSYQQIM